jgi:putative Mn2+ efflux pump MntP
MNADISAALIPAWAALTSAKKQKNNITCLIYFIGFVHFAIAKRKRLVASAFPRRRDTPHRVVPITGILGGVVLIVIGGSILYQHLSA